MNSIQLSNNMEESESIMCPCGSNDLHPIETIIYDRKEDNESKITVVPMSESVYYNHSSKIGENPSPRREGISIIFLCEMCQRQLKLQIAQHKGPTFMWLER